MLSRLASYLLGGAADAEEDSAAVPQEEGQASGGNLTAVPVEARLRQVEVEGDDWILIDRNENAGAMDESWYVTPPACFTQPGPVHVETSPLEDLLIEHPSMSVYRSAGPKSHHHSHHHKDTKPGESVKQRVPKRRPPIPEPSKPAVATASPVRIPFAPRVNEVVSRKSNSSRHHHHHHHHHNNNKNNNNSHHHQHVDTDSSNNNATAGAVVEQQPGPRRSSIRDLRNARGDENLRIVQIRSAQKVLEKRTSQSAKRNRLERGNKVREVASGSRRPSKRQDRIRVNNSGANNDRRCRY